MLHSKKERGELGYRPLSIWPFPLHRPLHDPSWLAVCIQRSLADPEPRLGRWKKSSDAQSFVDGWQEFQLNRTKLVASRRCGCCQVYG
jgi:hypothetical protein